MFQDISLADLLKLQKEGNHSIVDVRSPKEFKEATIPGSINIPVFDNEERTEVGTIYKQVGPEAAKERGLEIFSKKLPSFIAAFKQIDTPLTVFCWRGGMRSKTAATVLDLMGIHANRLAGGIRSYRHWVVSELEKETFHPKLYVLNGYTGTGKTKILSRLAEKGYPVIDLEGMAGHRGSIFGHIGMEPNKQKKFESLLVTAMENYQHEPFVFIEGESKRIGNVVLPDFFYHKKENGLQIYINLPIGERVENILNDYQPWEYPERFNEAFQLIKKRIHTPIAKQIEEDLANGQYALAVKRLLEYYYDPRYQYANEQNANRQQIFIQAGNVDHALEQLLTFVSKSEKNNVF